MVKASSDLIKLIHVDDEPDFAEMAAEFIRRQDDRFDVETVTSANEALERLRENTVDCIVSDFDMPGQNGIEFLKAVRSDNPDLPFILYTGKGSEEVASEAISAGVTDYLQKESGAEQYEILANKIVSSVQKYRSEQELERVRTRFQAVFEKAPDLIAIHDRKGNYLEVNEQLQKKLGYSQDELTSINITDTGRGLTPDEVHDMMEEMQLGETRKVESVYERKDGSTFPVEIWSNKIEIDGDVRFLAFGRDITDQMERERKVRETNQRLDLALEGSKTGVWAWDMETDGLVFDEMTEQLFGIKPGEFEGTLDAFMQRVHPDDRKSVETAIKESIESGERYEATYRIQRDDGEQRWIQGQGEIASNGDSGRMVGIVSDVTERKERERDLKQLKEEYETVFNTAQDAIFLFDVHETDGDYEFTLRNLNPVHEAISGLSAEEDRGKTPRELLGEEAGEEVAANFRRCIESGKPISYEEQLEMPTGTVYSQTKLAQVTEEGRVTAIVGIGRDITERKEREQELSRLKRRYETVIEAAPDSVFVADTETGEILKANSAAEELLGTTRENIVGRKYTAIAPAEDAELYQEVFERAQKESETITRLSNGSRPQLLTDDGETVPVEFSAGVASVADGEVVIGIFRDISERVAKEQAIQDRNERLETFANVVSHDLRNPLNVASGRLEMAIEECDSEHLTKIEEAHDRMGVLIEDLLVLAQQGESVGEQEAVALSELCHECWEGVNTEGPSIDIDIDRTIRADASRLKQIFENLFRNAAVHGGDNVTVTVGELDGGFYVEDDGTGISDAEVGDVFQVGHSTKVEGTGFGLSIVKEIVEAHNWDIRVTEGTDGGARFEITGVEFIAE